MKVVQKRSVKNRFFLTGLEGGNYEVMNEIFIKEAKNMYFLKAATIVDGKKRLILEISCSRKMTPELS